MIAIAPCAPIRLVDSHPAPYWLVLRSLRREAGLTLGQLSLACTLYMLRSEGIDLAGGINSTVFLAALQKGRCLDTTHLSKFEQEEGQEPWLKAKRTLCGVYSEILGREFRELDIFG